MSLFKEGCSTYSWTGWPQRESH